MLSLSTYISFLRDSRGDAGRDRPATFQNTYVWLVFLSAMDCIMTWMILHAGGTEVNSIANVILQRFDMAGMVIYKFILIGFVICCCERIAQERPKTGWRLAAFAVAASAFPVLVAFAQLLVYKPF